MYTDLPFTCLLFYCQEGGGGMEREETREMKSDTDCSDDESGTTTMRCGKLKKKALIASSKITHSLRKFTQYRIQSVSIEDIHDAEEEKAVLAFRNEILSRNLLPDRHDDYHKILRFGNHVQIVFFHPTISLLLSSRF